LRITKLDVFRMAASLELFSIIDEMKTTGLTHQTPRVRLRSHWLHFCVSSQNITIHPTTCEYFPSGSDWLHIKMVLRDCFTITGSFQSAQSPNPAFLGYVSVYVRNYAEL
jgi:hypothetical protein